MKTSIKTSTSSMTAVPKPLKFLRPHYETLTKLQEDWPEGDDKTSLADVLSVIGMTFSDDERQDTLKYRLLAPSSDIISWGHEYSRHLALEIGEVYGKRIVADEDTKDLVDLALILVPTFLQSNGEADAVDLMSELEIIEQLPNYVDENTYARVCLYMVSMVNLLTYPDNELFLKTAHDIYITYKQYTQAMVLAIRLNDIDLIKADFDKAQDPALKKQLGFLYSINVVSIFTVGRIGRLELGAVSLATMTATITCYAPFQGLATSLDTLCAQAYGSGHRHL
ncbi:hypothetical protein BN1708_016626, partial [Verticillium longisporum]